MPIQLNGKTYYGPVETAEKLGISYAQLRVYRMEGIIEDIKIGSTRFCCDEHIATNKERVHQRRQGRGREPHSESDPDATDKVA